jgi:anti-sigma B factor antagonist
MAARPDPFAVEVEQRDGLMVVRASGELDLATAETLDAALGDIDGARRVSLDLSGLSFIDSTGLRLMLSLDQRAKRDGFELSLVAPEPPADRPIRLCGLDKMLPFVASPASDGGASRSPATNSTH